MRRLACLLGLSAPLLAGLLLAGLLPAQAQASELSIATDEPRRPKRDKPDRDTMEREGPVFGFGVSPGFAILPHTFMPVMRFHGVLGGAISHRVMLEMDLGGTRFLGQKRGGFNGDLVLTGVLGRGVYVRGGVGGTSHSPAISPQSYRPGFGGLVGLGYDFDIADGEGASASLGVDYDLRMRTDGLPSQTVLFSIRVRVLPAMN